LLWIGLERGVRDTGGDTVAGIGGRGEVGVVVIELTMVGAGCAGGTGVGAIVLGAIGEDTGAGTATGIAIDDTIGFAIDVFLPALLRCTEPPVADMGVRSTPKATSAPPIPRSRVRLLRMLAPFFSVGSPCIEMIDESRFERWLVLSS
jgi:hypothetical protein